MEGFKWKNVNSTDMNIITEKLPPKDVAMARVEKVIISGRSGFLTLNDNSYDSIIKTVEFHFEKKGSINLDKLKAWLSGSSEVVFANDDDRYYKATIINQVNITEIIPTLSKVIVLFDCQPFGYLLNGSKTVTVSTNRTAIVNVGNYYSEPYMKLYGSGNITLKVNCTSILINNVDGYVEIDSELDTFYKGTESMENNVTGECPHFEVGENIIEWIGNVSKIEIIPRWRCL